MQFVFLAFRRNSAVNVSTLNLKHCTVLKASLRQNDESPYPLSAAESRHHLPYRVNSTRGADQHIYTGQSHRRDQMPGHKAA